MIIGIDPGASGGIAWKDGEGAYGCIAMPKTSCDIRDALIDLAVCRDTTIVYIEKVGQHRQGNDASSSVKFGRNCALLEGILITLFLKTIEVPPTRWLNALGVTQPTKRVKGENRPKKSKEQLAAERAERKHKTQDMMQKRYPTCKITLKTADAMALVAYGEMQNGDV